MSQTEINQEKEVVCVNSGSSAEVLIECNPALLPEIVALAEHAVFQRCLDLFNSTTEAEEKLDHRDAIAVLSQLETGIAISRQQQHSVS
jgi:hypothetical protein